MKNVFFYGPLAHVPLLEIVLGCRLEGRRFKAASLADYTAFHTNGQSYPVLVPQIGCAVDGLVLAELTPQEQARVEFHQGSNIYRLHNVTSGSESDVRQVNVFAPKPEGPQTVKWDYSGWQAQWAEITILAAIEAMGYFGQLTTGELALRYGSIWRRADSFHRGQSESGRAASHSREDVQVVDIRTPYSNFYAVQEYDLRHRKFNGDFSEQMERGVFVAFDAAIVLPYDPVLDCVLLIEQFRIGAYARGAKQPWLLEAVAGLVDVGETPEQCAMRETVEEAGVHLDRLIPISQAFPSPGNSTEQFYIYLGLCDLSGKGDTVSGVQSEDEDIRSHVLSFDAFMDFINASAGGAGGANVLPLITAAYWLAINREQLMQDA